MEKIRNVVVERVATAFGGRLGFQQLYAPHLNFNVINLINKDQMKSIDSMLNSLQN